jgi:cytochrome c biogenesis protein CcdA
VVGSLLVLGLLLGLKHALEADHVSTVATLASRSGSARQTVGVALAWGLGHAATLLLLGTALIGLDATLPQSVTRLLELAVGVILVVLGVGVLRRLRERHIHVHVHEHGGVRHLHAHAHVGTRNEHTDAHDHTHRPTPWRRSLLIGGIHGLAGTAAITVLALPLTGSTAQALLYLVAFGGGSVIGMIALSLVVSLPFLAAARHLGRVALGLEALLGIADVALGGWVVFMVSR